MKFTLSWLREFVDVPDDAAEVAAALEALGHEVEAMEPLHPSYRGVVIGKVLEVGPHPDADKIRVCRVDVGDEELEIVCGAWNFEAGATVPVAVPGAVLGGDFEIGRRTIRGVVSNGMICSERELEIGEDAAGILVLDRSYPDAAGMLGRDLTEVLDLPDVAFDVAITPNRPDCMSVIGLARDLAAYYEVALRTPDVRVDDGGAAATFGVTIDDPVACPRFVGREVRDIRVEPSPHWMRMRLAAAGVRPINNVVDASNYAMIELGHPTHAFDRDRLGDTIVVRRAAGGERIETLDDVERHLLTSDIVVADADRAVAVAGVMGGADTEVHEGTTSLVIEAAYWDPPSILLTSKRLKLRSEASARFERGMDPGFCRVAADRVAQLLVETGGARPGGLVDEYPAPATPVELDLPLAEIERVLGIGFESETAASMLRRLEFTVIGEDPLHVTAPTRRPDVGRPVDLIEELARLRGYDAVPERVATGPGGAVPRYEAAVRRIKDVLVGAGYHEAMLFSFIGESDLETLGLPEGDPRRETIHLLNPLREDEGVMRTTLLPGLLRAAAGNLARRLDGVRLFEVGKVFFRGDGPIPDQPDRLGFIAAGVHGSGWEHAGRGFDVYDATGLWELVAEELRLPAPAVRSVSTAPYHPERCAEVLVGDAVAGVVGEIHPQVAGAHGIEGRVVGGELDLSVLLQETPRFVFSAPSPYPPVIFDLAFEVDEAVSAAAVLDAVRGGAGDLLERLDLFDVFHGEQLGEGRKSLAVRLTLRAPDRTLTDEEMAPIRSEIADEVSERVGGALRGAA